MTDIEYYWSNHGLAFAAAIVAVALGVALAPFILPICGIVLAIAALVCVAILVRKYPIHALLIGGIAAYVGGWIYSIS